MRTRLHFLFLLKEVYLMRKIHWGMIGCGDVTEVKNGPGLYLNENCALDAICNRTYEKALDWAKRHNQPTVYRTLEELLADDRVEIVYIATTPDVHKEQALQCLYAGKHVYLEKPMFFRWEDALEIQQCARQQNRRVFVAHYRRGLPSFVKAKELIESGRLGEIRGARILGMLRREDLFGGWRFDTAVAGGGHFFEGDVHALDALDFLIGGYEKAEVWAEPFADDLTMERSVSILFRWKNGAIGSGLWCFDADHWDDAIEIFGTKGRLSLSSADLSRPVRLQCGGTAEEFVFEVPAHVGQEHERMIAEVLLTGKENPALCTLETGMRTFWLACEMKRALQR